MAVNGKKACDMSKVFIILYRKKVQNLHVSTFKYSLLNLPKTPLRVKQC